MDPEDTPVVIDLDAPVVTEGDALPLPEANETGDQTGGLGSL